jgi:hypothetical protein
MPRRTLFLTLTLCVSPSLLAGATTREEILPAGTIIHCTLDEPNFSSKTAQAGDPVLCHLGAVSAFGHSLFPRGAMLSGHLQDAKDPGRFVGKGWLELEFDRIILPGAQVLPLQAKIIAAPHLKTDREGKLHSGGHPKRDALGWMVPVLWPIKILTLPMRGPYPALKGEARLSMRLMEDVEVPVVAQAPVPPSPSATPSSYTPSTYWSLPPASVVMVTHQVVRVLEEESSEGVNPGHSEATTSLASARVPAQTSQGEPRSTLVMLRGGPAFVAAYYWVQGEQIHCVSRDGKAEVFPLESLDLEQTVRMNRERNLEFVLHRRNWLTEH